MLWNNRHQQSTLIVINKIVSKHITVYIYIYIYNARVQYLNKQRSDYHIFSVIHLSAWNTFAVDISTGSFDRKHSPPSHVRALKSRRLRWIKWRTNSPRLNGTIRRQRASVVSVVSRRSVGRTQYVHHGVLRSLITRLLCGVPQGSVQLLFILYTFDLIQLIEGHGMAPHLYTDNTQINGSCRPSNVSVFLSSISDCLRDVASWMKSNMLQIN